MSTSQHRTLHNSLQGVLAGGGASASAPLLIFTPFATLLVVAGAVSVTAGASLWLAALALLGAAFLNGAIISRMRHERGGNGLSEEEFGGWAIKINGAVTFVLYVVAFLISLERGVDPDRGPLAGA